MTQFIRTPVCLAVLCFTIVGCTGMAANKDTVMRQDDWQEGDHKLKVAADGSERHYIIHIPAGYDHRKKWPVVIMFHGGGGTAKAVMWDTRWGGKADEEGFLAVFPEGTPEDPTKPGSFRENPQTWNDGSGRPNLGAVAKGVPEKSFVSEMLRDLKSRFSIDERRIYATGFSNGGSMSFLVAREFANEVAAVCPVAGADWIKSREPDRPVPIMYITGTADPLNPMDGGGIHIGSRSFGRKPSVEGMMARWAQVHGCRNKPYTIFEEEGTTATAYCSDADKVLLYRLDNHGHHWPGGKIILPAGLAGENTTTLNATDVIWSFFRKHALP